MAEKFYIAAYCRISVDDELNKENTSIENQKAIIEDYVKTNFPNAELDFYEDRDKSGYTFEQREGYQKMRRKLFRNQYDILIIKDLSRFSRRNGAGLVELEALRDEGIRIIAIGDNIDYPTNDDWLRIQIYFFMNEMPVTDTSKKVRNVIRRRQQDGKWICSVPYGYVITNSKTMAFEVEPTEAVVVQKVFELYNQGWGYKRIANYLTEQHIPTPRMNERARKESRGEECHIKAKPRWSIATIQGMLTNDFYIGTLRQGKYTRKKINGQDIKCDESEHIIFLKNHEPIIDYERANQKQLPRYQEIPERLLRLNQVRRLRQSDVSAYPSRPKRRLPLRRIPQARAEGLHQPPRSRGHTRCDCESVSANGARHFIGNDRKAAGNNRRGRKSYKIDPHHA